MSEEEFIGKLQMCYFGDRNAFNEIVEVYRSAILENKQLTEKYLDAVEKCTERDSKNQELIDYLKDKIKEHGKFAKQYVDERLMYEVYQEILDRIERNK